METILYLFLVGATWLLLQYKFQGDWAPGKELLILIASIFWPATWFIGLLQLIFGSRRYGNE